MHSDKQTKKLKVCEIVRLKFNEIKWFDGNYVINRRKSCLLIFGNEKVSSNIENKLLACYNKVARFGVVFDSKITLSIF